MPDAKKTAVIEALKNAIMTEIKGQQLYQHAAITTEDAAARSMFERLAKDEDEHVAILQAQYKHLVEDGQMDLSAVHPGAVDHGAATVIDNEFIRSVKRGKFEMAVIGIGCDLENKAIDYYDKEAARTEDENLRQLFTWLARWEDGHLKSLLELQKVLQDEYWADQGFSPM